jgi:lipoprotein-releasing system ATP-binding protein
MTEALIRATGLSKIYGDGDRHRVEVLRELDLHVDTGEKVVIVGQSGVGKSTLLHVLGALDRPTTGEVWFGGQSLTAMNERDLAAFRNREIGFIFQFHHLLPDFTALENTMMPGLIRGMGWDEAVQRARGVLAQVGLAHRLEHKPGELSGGEQQRVAVARAVVLSPRAVLADEPTGNLDPATADEVHELLMDLNRTRGITLVIVTHNDRLAALADRTLRLPEGRLANCSSAAVRAVYRLAPFWYLSRVLRIKGFKACGRSGGPGGRGACTPCGAGARPSGAPARACASTASPSPATSASRTRRSASDSPPRLALSTRNPSSMPTCAPSTSSASSMTSRPASAR